MGNLAEEIVQVNGGFVDCSLYDLLEHSFTHRIALLQGRVMVGGDLSEMLLYDVDVIGAHSLKYIVISDLFVPEKTFEINVEVSGVEIVNVCDRYDVRRAHMLVNQNLVSRGELWGGEIISLGDIDFQYQKTAEGIYLAYMPCNADIISVLSVE